MTSRPVIGSPPSGVSCCHEIAAREHVAERARRIGADVAPEVLDRIGDAGRAFAEDGLAQFQFSGLLGLGCRVAQTLGECRVEAGRPGFARLHRHRIRQRPHLGCRRAPELIAARRDISREPSNFRRLVLEIALSLLDRCAAQHVGRLP